MVAVFFGAFVLSLANTAHADVFPECSPAIEAAKLGNVPDADAWVKRICDAQNATLAQWEKTVCGLPF